MCVCIPLSFCACGDDLGFPATVVTCSCGPPDVGAGK